MFEKRLLIFLCLVFVFSQRQKKREFINKKEEKIFKLMILVLCEGRDDSC